MQILSKQFLLPKNTRDINQNTRNVNYVNKPAFRATKTTVIDSLSKELSNNIKLDAKKLKEILGNPEKRTLFFEMLGAAIVSTVTNLMGVLDADTSDKTTTKTQGKSSKSQANSATNGSEAQSGTLTSEIKFDSTKGATPQIEKDFKNFVLENFAENQAVLDRLKLLFNKFAAYNRKGNHILNEKTVSNKEILNLILTELKELKKGDIEGVNEIINKYQNLLKIESTTIVHTPSPKKIEIDIPNEIKQILNRYASLKEAYINIIETSKTKSEANKRIISINNLLLILEEKKDLGGNKKPLQAINQQYYSELETIASILENLYDRETDDFIKTISRLELSFDALKNWQKDKDKLGCSFLLYNELSKANLTPDNLKKLILMQKNKRFNNIKIFPDANTFILSTTKDRPLNKTFSNIKEIFELITGEKVTLKAEDDIEINNESLTQALKKDYFKHGETTYPNIVSYLYGPKFKVYNEGSFDFHKIDYRLTFILNALNNKDLFNPNFFSPHCKLRFIERFVLNENFGNKTLEDAISEKTRFLINKIKEIQEKGIMINTYRTPDNLTGILIPIPTDEFGDIKITLDDRHKIHTIF